MTSKDFKAKRIDLKFQIKELKEAEDKLIRAMTDQIFPYARYDMIKIQPLKIIYPYFGPQDAAYVMHTNKIYDVEVIWAHLYDSGLSVRCQLCKESVHISTSGSAHPPGTQKINIFYKVNSRDFKII